MSGHKVVHYEGPMEGLYCGGRGNSPETTKDIKDVSCKNCLRKHHRPATAYKKGIFKDWDLPAPKKRDIKQAEQRGSEVSREIKEGLVQNYRQTP